MSSYKDYKKRALQNSEVKAEYDALQPEYDIIQAMIDARVQQNMTQKDLSAKTGIYAGRYKLDREWNKKSQPEYGEKTCTGIRDAIKTGICSDANKK